MFDWISDLFGGGNNSDSQQTTVTDWQPAPEFPEAAAARGTWADTLQKWGSQPGYGAIQPNWSDIWENARQKVSRYFNGGPEGPGVNAKVAARSAARGVGDQAAGDAMLQRSGFQEGNMLQDLAIQQAMNEANLGESGRTNWMNSLMSLAGQKPQMLNYGSTTTKEYDRPGVATGAGQSFLSNPGGVMDLFQPVMDLFGGGGSNGLDFASYTDTGIGDVTDGGDEGDMWSDPQTYAQLAQLAMMFA